eukprot:CAMPEP_0204341378 /NCGR_PEP_ID=MMETSP0469-20131031/23307_1 /ASSEMBLY_ACC=CAM_ASM_000384 /TAXON_ID=2969 /ORGANISM="Oxyrrhis marina" /LENGTH=204 /DNA_ID=CAMNT_0051326087 /DNA_START=47 /DNA_END=661 /DNA_ORIENTATION=-
MSDGQVLAVKPQNLVVVEDAGPRVYRPGEVFGGADDLDRALQQQGQRIDNRSQRLEMGKLNRMQQDAQDAHAREAAAARAKVLTQQKQAKRRQVESERARVQQMLARIDNKQKTKADRKAAEQREIHQQILQMERQRQEKAQAEKQSKKLALGDKKKRVVDNLFDCLDDSGDESSGESFHSADLQDPTERLAERLDDIFGLLNM